MDKKRVLIIGGDSVIAHGLCAKLNQYDIDLIATTRRAKQISKKKLFLDLEKDAENWVTPEQAIRDGADFIVVGRPIIAADDPEAACRLFSEKIQQA